MSNYKPEVRISIDCSVDAKVLEAWKLVQETEFGEENLLSTLKEEFEEYLDDLFEEASQDHDGFDEYGCHHFQMKRVFTQDEDPE